MGQIAAALYCMYRHHISRDRAASLTQILPGDISYILELAERVGSSLSLIGTTLDEKPQIKSDADSYFEDLIVSVDERALEDMLLATVESYEARGTHRGERYRECYGWCLGYETRSEPHGHEKRFTTILRITRVVTQIRAKAGANFVIPNDGSARAIRRVASRFFPHLRLLGDYHTHPFATRQLLLNKKGWKYSTADQQQVAEWVTEVRQEGVNPRFSIVVAVAKGDRSGRQMAKLATNRWKIGVANLSLVVAVYRIRHDGKYEDEDNVTLNLTYLSDAGA